jgi:hypothetical protein
VAGILTQADTLHLNSTAIGAIATVDLVGALVFGLLSDRLAGETLPGDPSGLSHWTSSCVHVVANDCDSFYACELQHLAGHRRRA